jgi:tripartite-type tricarboxylate transporter receptor subunit TctC
MLHRHAKSMPPLRPSFSRAPARCLSVTARIARAQAYPARQVRIIVGFPPAGSDDIHARLIAQWVSERLGQQFIVENRAGAGG